jgi:hypothetical protein
MTLVTFLSLLIMTVVWGYFSDIRRGYHVGWFVGRIVFVMTMVTLLSFTR